MHNGKVDTMEYTMATQRNPNPKTSYMSLPNNIESSVSECKMHNLNYTYRYKSKNRFRPEKMLPKLVQKCALFIQILLQKPT